MGKAFTEYGKLLEQAKLNEGPGAGVQFSSEPFYCTPVFAISDVLNGTDLIMKEDIEVTMESAYDMRKVEDEFTVNFDVYPFKVPVEICLVKPDRIVEWFAQRDVQISDVEALRFLDNIKKDYGYFYIDGKVEIDEMYSGGYIRSELSPEYGMETEFADWELSLCDKNGRSLQLTAKAVVQAYEDANLNPAIEFSESEARSMVAYLEEELTSWIGDADISPTVLVTKNMALAYATLDEDDDDLYESAREENNTGTNQTDMQESTGKYPLAEIMAVAKAVSGILTAETSTPEEHEASGRAFIAALKEELYSNHTLDTKVINDFLKGMWSKLKVHNF